MQKHLTRPISFFFLLFYTSFAQANICKDIFERIFKPVEINNEILRTEITREQDITSLTSLEKKLAFVYQLLPRNQKISPELWAEKLQNDLVSKNLFKYIQSLDFENGISEYQAKKLALLASRKNHVPMRILRTTNEDFTKKSLAEEIERNIFLENMRAAISTKKNSAWEQTKQFSQIGYLGLKNSLLVAANIASVYFIYVPLYMPSKNLFVYASFSKADLQNYQDHGIEFIWDSIKQAHPYTYNSTRASRLISEGVIQGFTALAIFRLSYSGGTYLNDNYISPPPSVVENRRIISEVYPGYIDRYIFKKEVVLSDMIQKQIQEDLKKALTQEDAEVHFNMRFNLWKDEYTIPGIRMPDINNNKEHLDNWLDYAKESLERQYALEFFEIFAIDFEQKFQRRPNLNNPEDFLSWKVFIERLNSYK